MEGCQKDQNNAGNMAFKKEENKLKMSQLLSLWQIKNLLVFIIESIKFLEKKLKMRENNINLQQNLFLGMLKRIYQIKYLKNNKDKEKIEL